MELNNIPKLVIGLVVAILIITVVAVPIIDDLAQDIHSTDNNADAAFMMSTDSQETITLGFDSSNRYTVNGIEIPQPANTNWRIKAFWPGGFIKLNSGAFAYIDNSTSFVSGITQLIFDPTSQTITYTNASGDTTLNNIPYIYYMAEEGDFGLFRGSIVNVSSDSQYFVFIEDRYQTGVGSYGSGFMCENGELKDTIIEPRFSSDNGGSMSPATITFDIESSQVDAAHLRIDGISNIKINDMEVNTTATIVAPIEYQYYSSGDNAIISIIGVIPILLVVALIIGVVGLTVASRSGAR